MSTLPAALQYPQNLIYFANACDYNTNEKFGSFKRVKKTFIRKKLGHATVSAKPLLRVPVN